MEKRPRSASVFELWSISGTEGEKETDAANPGRAAWGMQVVIGSIRIIQNKLSGN